MKSISHSIENVMQNFMFIHFVHIILIDWFNCVGREPIDHNKSLTVIWNVRSLYARTRTRAHAHIKWPNAIAYLF